MNRLAAIGFLLAFVAGASAQTLEACTDEGRPLDLDGTEPGVFRSENWPNGTYAPNSLCEWVIQIDDGLTLTLEFLNFTLESSEGCKSDYVEVYDGASDNADLVGVYCGQTPPGIITATDGALFVRFVSDESVEYQGFLARYGEPYDRTACTTSRPADITNGQGIFQSINYPADYPPNARCEWRFQGERDETWTVRFADFETEDCCDCDYMDIFDGPATFYTRLGRWFGANTLPPAITSSGDGMYIRFLADFSIQRKGFIGVYQKNID
jgi:hypothetical protein